MGLRGTPIPEDDFPVRRRKDLTLTSGKIESSAWEPGKEQRGESQRPGGKISGGKKEALDEIICQKLLE